ncbi:MAG: hypothetical protein KAR19_01905 [Bacteroidales bacterium]|nr:hypothetical protein [Bacteroidales bacterium]
MRLTDFIILISILLCPAIDLQAQSTVEVTNPVLSLKGSDVQISFDLLNSSRSDIFTIRIEVTNSEGKAIDARSLSGDIGKSINGGRNKKILWDIESDSIFLDEEIFVQVYALTESVPVVEKPQVVETEEPTIVETEEPIVVETEEPIVVETEEPIVVETEETPAVRAGAESGSVNKEYNRTSIILQSVAFPGLGLSRTNPGQPHWIRGIAGYGCIAGSIYFNSKAVSSYQAYKNTDNQDEVDNLFNQAVKQDNISEALAFIAIGIWVTDLVWTIAGTSGLKNDQISGDLKRFSIGTTVEPVSSVPLIAFRYRF